MFQYAKKDLPTSSPNWALQSPTIEGLQIREVKNIITGNGHTVEVFREDWGLHDLTIRHAIAVTLAGGAISAWHAHKKQTDHIMVISGSMQTVFFDAREDSPTYQQISVYNLSALRPALAVIPPGVFHGFHNRSAQAAVFNNLFDVQYNYADPDEYRLPYDTDLIPFKFF